MGICPPNLPSGYLDMEKRMAIVLCVIPLIAPVTPGSRKGGDQYKGTLRVEMVYSRVPVTGETIFIFNKEARRFLDVSVKSVRHFPAGYIQENNRTVDAKVVCEEYNCTGHLGGFEAIEELWSHMVY